MEGSRNKAINKLRKERKKLRMDEKIKGGGNKERKNKQEEWKEIKTKEG